MTAGLSHLLSALRAAGLTLGTTELLRLQTVFARAPVLGDGDEPLARLKGVVRAVVVKRREDDAAFERVFGEWEGRLERDEEVSRLAARSLYRTDAKSPWRSRLRRTWQRYYRVALVVAILLALGLAVERPSGWRHAKPIAVTTATSSPTTTSTPPPVVPPPAPQPRTLRAGWQVQSYEATITFSWIRRKSWLLPLSLGLFSLVAGAGLTWFSRRRGFFSPPPPFLAAPGPSRVFLSPPLPRGPLLLDPQEEEAVVYGIGRFISEEPTRRLNVPATVRAIVRAAGLPRLVFERARFHREVWLWVDETAESSTLARAAAEVEAALAAHGLPFERASFRGAPFQLVSAGGQVFAPNEVDERRDAAIVAILTDGRLLSLQAEEGDRRLRLRALLRFLAGWPRLAFFDATGNAHELAGLLQPHGLSSLPLSQLPEFLEGGRSRAGRQRVDLDLWAAACALAPSPVSEATALVLRRRLDLPVPAWGLSALVAATPGSAGRLAFAPVDRARLLDLLVASESHPAGQVAEGSLLARALTAWNRVYAAEERTREESSVPWKGTLAARRLQVERALLELWRHPEEAAAKLFELFSGPLQNEIEGQLQRLAPAGRGGMEQARFPWRWESLGPVARAQLYAMKLGGDLPVERLRRSGGVWLVLGLCTGLGIGGLGAAVARFERPPVVPAPVRVRVNTIQANGKSERMIFVRIPGGEFQMGSQSGESDEKPAHRVVVSEFWMGQTEVANRQYRMLQPVHPGDAELPVVNVNWQEADRFCQSLGEGYRLPTEAEWEYAARADTQTVWLFWDEKAMLGKSAWYRDNAESELHVGARKLPNSRGLYDMRGNVWEWVEDWYGPYSKEREVDPEGPREGVVRVLRGGSFDYEPRFLRSQNRNKYWPEYRSQDIGFRCVLRPRRHSTAS